MNTRAQPFPGITFTGGVRWLASAPLRWALAGLFLLLSWQAFQLSATELRRQSVRVDMQTLQSGGEIQPAELAARARGLDDHPFPGAQADVRADALALVDYRKRNDAAQDALHRDSDEVVREYRLALSVRPEDGALWARYGHYLASRVDSDQQADVREAFEQALALSPRDYNAMRLLADLGIRLWPALGCPSRIALLDLLEQATVVDDHILSRWNTVFGQRPMARYLTELYAYHEFNPRWARISAAQCPAEGG